MEANSTSRERNVTINLAQREPDESQTPIAGIDPSVDIYSALLESLFGSGSDAENPFDWMDLTNSEDPPPYPVALSRVLTTTGSGSVFRPHLYDELRVRRRIGELYNMLDDNAGVWPASVARPLYDALNELERDDGVSSVYKLAAYTRCMQTFNVNLAIYNIEMASAPQNPARRAPSVGTDQETELRSRQIEADHPCGENEVNDCDAAASVERSNRDLRTSLDVGWGYYALTSAREENP